MIWLGWGRRDWIPATFFAKEIRRGVGIQVRQAS